MAEMLNCLSYRTKRFCQRTNPLDYDDVDFVSRYRLSKGTFQFLLEKISPNLEKETERNHAISSTEQFAAALRYYACGSFQSVIGDTCGLSQPSIFRAISSVSKELDNLWDETIYFPVDSREIQTIKQAFYNIGKFPNVIGCIDGTHIPILKPNEYEWQYLNRKLYHSINVQAVCDYKGKFINMVVKHPGSAHDSFILQDSSLWTHMENNESVGFILGDSAYPCRKWLMTPLPNADSQSEKRYNYAHKRTRVLIENSFGVWKRRFAALNTPNRRSLCHVARDIRATAILHNYAILRSDPIPADAEEAELPQTEDDHSQLRSESNGFMVRRHLINNVFNT